MNVYVGANAIACIWMMNQFLSHTLTLVRNRPRNLLVVPVFSYLVSFVFAAFNLEQTLDIVTFLVMFYVSSILGYMAMSRPFHSDGGLSAFAGLVLVCLYSTVVGLLTTIGVV